MTLQASTIYRSGGATVEMIREPQPQPTTLPPETLIRIEARYSSVTLTPDEAVDVAEAIKVLLSNDEPGEPELLLGHRFNECHNADCSGALSPACGACCRQPESAHYGAKP